jgi:hypothetical protein
MIYEWSLTEFSSNFQEALGTKEYWWIDDPSVFKNGPSQNLIKKPGSGPSSDLVKKPTSFGGVGLGSFIDYVQ